MNRLWAPHSLVSLCVLPTPGAANDAGHSSEDRVEEDRVVRTTPAGEEVGETLNSEPQTLHTEP